MKGMIGVLAAVVIVSVGATAQASAQPLSAQGTHGATLLARVNVTMSEFKFVLSTKTARHGAFIFKVTNKGKIVHDFKIAGKKTPKLSPGKSATLKVTLTKGNHKYICTIDSHASFGMKGTFKAT